VPLITNSAAKQDKIQQVWTKICTDQ
jgi:hypothetical protein